MKGTSLLLAGAALVWAVTGCAAVPRPVSGPVGPSLDSQSIAGHDGSLQVFTATTTVEMSFQADSHPHLGYRILDASGRTVQFVRNHSSNLADLPDVVTLAPGTYRVVANSTWCGLVSVPVVIEAGRTTVVRLDGSGRGQATDARFVHLSDGEIVGWRAAGS